MIISSRVKSQSLQGDRLRVRLEYTLDDGRVVERGGGMYVESLAAAEQLLIDLEASVLASVRRSDSASAVELGIYTAYQQASLQDVQYQWLKVGFDEPQPYKSYLLMKDVGPSLLSLGYTDEQYAAAFGTTVEDVVAAKAKWAQLEINAVTLAAYAGVVV